MPPSAAETTRGLRDRPLGKALILVAVLLVAVLVSRSCGSTDTAVSQEEAVAIAERQVSFEPNDVVIRLVKQGLGQHEVWLVGLGVKDAQGNFERATNVQVDANTGAVLVVQEVVG
jgi:hypothetical protein